MYTAPSARAASTYRQASVTGASPYQLVSLLYDGLLQSLHRAEASLKSGDTTAKCEHITKAVRFIEEGLKLGLDEKAGGDLAANLRTLYDYCLRRLTIANLRNDPAPIAEVTELIDSVAQGWRGMAGGSTPAHGSMGAGA